MELQGRFDCNNKDVSVLTGLFRVSNMGSRVLFESIIVNTAARHPYLIVLVDLP